MVSTVVFKLSAAISLLAVAILGAFAPVYLVNYKPGNSTNGAIRNTSYELGNMLSAGVMVSAGFVHLLGAAIEDLSNVSKVFPLAPFLCGLGFILTLFADHLASVLSANLGWDNVHCSSTIAHAGEAVPRSLSNSEITGNHQAQMCTLIKTWLFIEGPVQNDVTPLISNLNNSNDIEHVSVNSHENDSNILKGRQALAVSSYSKIEKKVSFITAVLMAGALCFHSVLEGTAMGAQETLVDSLHIFIAIIAHKGLAAYALGSSIIDSGANMMRFWLLIILFAVSTPVGIAIGILVESVANNGVAAALSAVASGTFLYVAFMEIIPKEMRSLKYGFLKLVMLTIGFGCMSILGIWA